MFGVIFDLWLILLFTIYLLSYYKITGEILSGLSKLFIVCNYRDEGQLRLLLLHKNIVPKFLFLKKINLQTIFF